MSLDSKDLIFQDCTLQSSKVKKTTKSAIIAGRTLPAFLWQLVAQEARESCANDAGALFKFADDEVPCRVFLDDPKVDTKERWAMEHANSKTRICYADFEVYPSVLDSLNLIDAERGQLGYRPALRALLLRALDPRVADFTTGYKINLVDELAGTAEGAQLEQDATEAVAELQKMGALNYPGLFDGFEDVSGPGVLWQTFLKIEKLHHLDKNMCKYVLEDAEMALGQRKGARAVFDRRIRQLARDCAL